MPLITMHALAKTIQKKLNISEEEAKRYAEIVMDVFGFDDRIIDNILDYHDRQLFYRLQSEGLLSTERDDALLHDGRNWRIHYWVFQKPAIFPLHAIKTQRTIKIRSKNNAPTHRTLYSSLPQTAWVNRKTPHV